MLDVLVDEASEMALTERHHAIETLILDRPDEPLRIRVEIRTPAVGLIRFRGHILKGGYDVHDGATNQEPTTTSAV